MKIKEVDLRINRANFPQGELGTNKALRRRIAAAWKVYNESDDPQLVNAAYNEWGRLADELYEAEFGE